MKLEDCREHYNYFSGKASEIVRTLALAGIAIVWVFKTAEGAEYRIPKEFILPLALLLICLGADLLQYVYATAAWGIFHRAKEVQYANSARGHSQEFLAPRWINWPTLSLFWLKVLAVTTAYALLLQFLYHRGANP